MTQRLTDLLTGVSCRATSVAKNTRYKDQSERMHKVSTSKAFELRHQDILRKICYCWRRLHHSVGIARDGCQRATWLNILMPFRRGLEFARISCKEKDILNSEMFPIALFKNENKLKCDWSVITFCWCFIHTSVAIFQLIPLRIKTSALMFFIKVSWIKKKKREMTEI